MLDPSKECSTSELSWLSSNPAFEGSVAGQRLAQFNYLVSIYCQFPAPLIV